MLRLSAADAGGVMGLRAEVDVCRPSVERESEGGEGACENGADDEWVHGGGAGAQDSGPGRRDGWRMPW